MQTLLSPAAVAEIAGVSTVAVWKAIHAGRIRARAVIGPDAEPAAWAVTKNEAERWARERPNAVRKN